MYIYHVLKVSHKSFLDWGIHRNCFIVLCVLCEFYNMFVCGETIIKY